MENKCPACSLKLSGVVVTTQLELVPNVSIEVVTPTKKLTTVTDVEGAFMLQVPSGPISVKVSGRNLVPLNLNFTASELIEKVQWKITYIIPPIAENVTIDNDVLAPDVERRDDSIYKNSLFARDDQLVFTLNAGINAGQHEGGGKSLEIRRFGFNTDHGGVNGGLKILVDNFQQNQGHAGTRAGLSRKFEITLA